MEKEYVCYKVDCDSYKAWLNHCDYKAMSRFFRYCEKWIAEKWNTQIDPIPFLDDFMQSNLRHFMERGYHSLVYDGALYSLEKYILKTLNDDLSKYEVDEPVNFDQFKLEWIGNMYAHLRARTDYTSAYIHHKLPMGTMLRHYVNGHEASMQRYYDSVIPNILGVPEKLEFCTDVDIRGCTPAEPNFNRRVKKLGEFKLMQ